MAFRFSVLPRVPSSLVALFALMAAPHPSAGPQIRSEDSIERARHFAWLNNWSEAARVLERLKATGQFIGDEPTALFAKAVEIRGNIEALPLPSAGRLAQGNEIPGGSRSRYRQADRSGHSGT